MIGIKDIGKNDRKLIANTIRIISAEMVEEANAGDPAFPMGCADLAYVLWYHFLQFYPDNTKWAGRDRFILSPGYGSALLYTLLHLYGFQVGKEDWKNYRNLDSLTPATPEYGVTPGVEATTGPPGQGFAMGIGMAIAAKMRAARYNKSDYNIFGEHNVYGLLSNSDIMEGITSEAASLAGHLQLDNIIYLYAKEKVVLNNERKECLSEDVKQRFKAYGWHTMKINGHSHRAIHTALKKAVQQENKPTLIIARIHSGYGSPSEEDSPTLHNNPLGRFELKETKRRMGFSPSSSFYIPREVKKLCKARVESLEEKYFDWLNRYNEWKNAFPELSTEWDECKKESVPENLEQILLDNINKGQMATRQMSKMVLEKLLDLFPNLITGAAGRIKETGLDVESGSFIKKNKFKGNRINFGLREHAMTATLNGLTLDSDFITVGSTYLVYSDYMKPALRMAGMMDLPIKYIFTQDSCRIGGEKSQHPVEQLTMLRSIPGMTVIRPADRKEVAAAWSIAMQKHEGPCSLIFTNQPVLKLRGIEDRKLEDIMRGGYIASKSRDKFPDVTIVASGSELKPSLEAKKTLMSYGITVRVVSMPCREIFMQQPRKYRNSVIPIKDSIVAVVEASNSMGWEELTWLPLRVIGVDKFTKSGPKEEVTEDAGMDSDSIAHEVDRFVGWIEEWEEDKENLEREQEED